MWQVPVIVMVLAATAVPVGFRSPAQFTVGFDDPLDAIENVLGYIPVGIVLGWLGPFWGVVAAAGMSIFAETFQTVMQHRDPSVADLVTNVIGAILGMVIRNRWEIYSPGLPVKRWVSLIAGVAAAALVLSVWVSSGVPSNPHGITESGRLESYWKLDEPGGRIALDSSGHGLNGRIRYEPKRAEGAKGTAIEFDGKKNSIDFGHASAFRLTGSMTISAWIQSTSFPFDDAAIVSNRDRDELGYQLDTTVDQGQRTIGFKLADPCGHLMARYGKTVLETGAWYHVAGVYNAAAKSMDVYLNGELDNGPLVGMVSDRQRSSREPLFVGKRSGGDKFEFAGSIRDVRIYSGALTKPEISSDMKGPGNASAGEPSTFSVLPQSAAIGCRGTTDPEDARIPGAIATFGVLVAMAFVGLWPSGRPLLSALASFAAGLIFLPAMSSTIPALAVWAMPFISLAGGISVAISTRSNLPYPAPQLSKSGLIF